MSDPTPQPEPGQPEPGQAEPGVDEPTVAAAMDAEQQGETLSDTALPDEYPQKPAAAFEHGTTEREMAEGEPLEDKLARENPDVSPAPLGDTRSTPLLDDADEDGTDREGTSVAEIAMPGAHVDDSGQPAATIPAEEAAVRVDPSDEAPGTVDRQAVIQRPAADG